MVRTHLDRAVVAVRGKGDDADAAPPLDEQVEGEPALEHRAGGAVGGVDQGAFHLRPGRRAAGVHDTRA